MSSFGFALSLIGRLPSIRVSFVGLVAPTSSLLRRRLLGRGGVAAGAPGAGALLGGVQRRIERAALEGRVSPAAEAAPQEGEILERMP